MRFSTDISLPAGVEPAWPDACIACAVEPARGRMKLRSFPVTLWAFFLPPTRWHTVEVPACPDCGPRLRSRRRWSVARALLACFLAVAVVRWSTGYSTGGWSLPAQLWLTIALVFPYFVVRALRVPVFAFEPRRRITVYRFAEPGYAEVFRELNAGRGAERPGEPKPADRGP